MPIFDYNCKNCSKDFEYLHLNKKDKIKECPYCGGKNLKKKLGIPAIKFKGSGFYETDYKKKT
jgi:putative FmdB family regulatory protein